jgi:serine/threonine protein kinase
MNTESLIIGERSARIFVKGRIIGQGDLGTVYRAKEKNVAYALKLPLDEEIHTEMLEKEAAVQSEVLHPNITPVVLFDRQEETPFLVTPLASTNLKRFIQRNGRPTPEQAFSLSEDLGDALNTMHKSGIMHSDIKPSNILLYRNAGRITGKLTDFGGALHIGDSQDTVWLSPAYAAPELDTFDFDNPLTRAIDQYGWAAGIAYPTFTGRSPFGNTVTREDKTYTRDYQASYPPFETLIPKGMTLLHEAAEAVVTRALQKYPENRYASMEELLDDLRHRRAKAEEGEKKQVKILA